MNDARYYACDWSHKEEKLAVYDPVANKTSAKLPEPAPDLVLVTENMPPKLARPFLQAGATILRCPPTKTASLRKEVQAKDSTWEKTDPNDVKLIWMLYKYRPAAFRPMKLSPPLASYYAIFKDYQEVRIRTGNRLYADMSDALSEFFETVEKGEKQLLKVVANELKAQPIYTQWLQNIKGIGPAMAGGLISLIGDVERFDSVSKLWAYAGYSVDNGAVQKRKRGEVANWNNKIRTLCYNLVDMFIKHRTPVYRAIYDNEKARQVAKGITLGHAHNRAIRRTAKIFLQHYWLVARTLAGLPVSAPWIIEHGGHTDYIAPPGFEPKET